MMIYYRDLTARQVHHIGVALAAVDNHDTVVLCKLIQFPVIDRNIQDGNHADKSVPLKLSLIDYLRGNIHRGQELLQSVGGGDGVGIGEVVGLDKNPARFLFQQCNKLIRKNRLPPLES